VIAFFAVAFAVSVQGVAHHPRAAFYLLPFRAWELGLGAIVATIAGDARGGPGWLREAVGLAGLAAILAAMFAYQKTTPFPGTAALLPCVGTALFLRANDGGPTLVGRVLSWKPVVFVGLVSYSFYLWHWPLFVFANYWTLDPLPVLQRVGLALASFLLAVASWKFVESPFRRRRVFRTRPGILRLGLVASVVLLAAGLAISRTGGIPARMPASVVDFADARFDRAFIREMTLEEAREGRFTPLGVDRASAPVEVLVWGDSHAMALLPAVDRLCRESSVRGLAATHSVSAPLLGEIRGEPSFEPWPDTRAFNEATFEFVRAHRVRNVVLAGMWAIYQDDRNAFVEAFRTTTAALNEAGATVWVVEDTPKFPWDVPKALARAAFLGDAPADLSLPSATYEQQLRRQDIEFVRTLGPGVKILRPGSYLSRGDVVPISGEGIAIYRDSDHLSVHGAMLLVPMFAPVLSR
jgi:hypothetical protein